MNNNINSNKRAFINIENDEDIESANLNLTYK